MQPIRANIHGKLERLRYLYRHGGVGGLLFHLVYRLTNRVTRLRIFKVAIFDATMPVGTLLGRLDGYRHGLLQPAELKRYAADPENDLSVEFLDYAAAQGDTCYATFEGDKLISYCWNSAKPTVVERGLHIEFAQGYIYRYKEFTRRSHRGRRLSTFARAESLCQFAEFGVKGFAGYVEADNYVSFGALQRSGHVFPGFIVVLGSGAKPWIWHSPGARAAGFRVVSTPPEAETIPGQVKSTL